jgi:chromosomal replication initiation ATPase DnaA
MIFTIEFLDEQVARMSEKLCVLHCDLVGGRRFRKLAFPRHLIRYALKENTLLPLRAIASLTGAKDHSSVLNSIKKVRYAMEDNSVSIEYKTPEHQYYLMNYKRIEPFVSFVLEYEKEFSEDRKKHQCKMI